MEKYNGSIAYLGIKFNKYSPLSFEDDFLAGIRYAYFTSGCSEQTGRVNQQIAGSSYSLAYTMKADAQLSWKLLRNGSVFQSAELCGEGMYCVVSFSAEGIPCERQYYDFDHNWLKSVYLTKSGFPECTVYPGYDDEQDVITVIRSTGDSTVKSFLFPKSELPEDSDYSLLAYTPDGFLYFNSVPNKKQITRTVIHDDFAGAGDGFDFDPVDFDMQRNLNVSFNLADCDYLTDDNGNPTHTLTNAQYNQPEPEDEADYDSVRVYQREEAEPDLSIQSGGESYSYYGELDGENRRTGYGRTAAPDGKTAYEGGYELDKRSGFGTFYYKGGRLSYAGNWDKNIRSGFGVGFRSSDGSAYIGNWDDNSPDGIGARFGCDGSFIFLGTYVNGKKHGKGITIDEDGSFILSVFENDEVTASYKIDDLIENL